MTNLNRDTIVAIVLLLFCGVMFWATTLIRDPGFEQMGADVWPRIVLLFVSVLSLIFLVQSLRPEPRESLAEHDGSTWLARYQNPTWCFVLFFGFLATMPFFGMLIGGALFVFLMMSVLGGWSPRLLLLHAAIAVLSIGLMWSIFTFGLRVILPEGEIIKVF